MEKEVSLQELLKVGGYGEDLREFGSSFDFNVDLYLKDIPEQVLWVYFGKITLVEAILDSRAK